MPNPQHIAIKPDIRGADTLIVLIIAAAFKMNKQRNAHAVLQSLAESLRDNHAADLLHALGGHAVAIRRQQKNHAGGKQRVQSRGDPS